MKTLLALGLMGVVLGTMAIAQQPTRFAKTSTEREPNGGPYRPDQARYVVGLINEAQVPGQEAGVLIELNAVDGQEVKEGELLGKIDDTQPYMQGLIASAEHKAAKEKADNDVDVRYAKKASEVARKEWEKSVAANKSTHNAVSAIEVDRQFLTYERGLLETERAESERKIAAFTVEAKQVEIKAAWEAMKRREIRSPVEGRVVEVYLHKGEWVRPGDPVLHVVQLDRLKVEGYLEIKDYSPGQVIDRPVTVEATLQNRKVQFNGRITYVKPFIEGLGDKYLVKAEVENRKEDGHWLLLPGLYVDMKIQL